jgi:lysophospholipase L1-like esterase
VPLPRLALLLVLVAVAATGCGGGGEPAPASAPAVPQVDVDISAPANGEAVVAQDRVGSRLVAKVTIEGTADVGASLIARTSCEEADCQHSFTTDTDGTFSEPVEVWAAADGRNGSIEVGAAGSAPADRDRVVVLVEPPKQRNSEVKAKPKEPKRRKQGKRNKHVPADPPPVVQPIPVLPPEAEAEPPVTLPPAPQIPAPASNTGRTLIMIGDSLAQGTEPYLAGQLGGWSVATDARRGRPLAEGMQVLSRTQIPNGPLILAFSLFTNDAPTNVAALESAVRTSVQRAGPRGCAVWATIVRPPVGGTSYAAANAKLGQLAGELRGRLLVVPWAQAVASNPSLVGKDGVHASSAGYQERARLYAATARTCSA